MGGKTFGPEAKPLRSVIPGGASPGATGIMAIAAVCAAGTAFEARAEFETVHPTLIARRRSLLGSLTPGVMFDEAELAVDAETADLDIPDEHADR